MTIFYLVAGAVYLWYVSKAFTYELLIEEIKMQNLPDKIKLNFKTNKLLLFLFAFSPLGPLTMIFMNKESHKIVMQTIIEQSIINISQIGGFSKDEISFIDNNLKIALLTDDRFDFYL
jgi:hypothetical protein